MHSPKALKTSPWFSRYCPINPMLATFDDSSENGNSIELAWWMYEVKIKVNKNKVTSSLDRRIHDQI